MAEIAVSFLLDKLSALLEEEVLLLGGLDLEIQFIRDELGQMNEFLRGSVNRDDHYLEWIGQLREIAYDVEDVLDKYVIRFQQLCDANGFQKAYASIKNLNARRQIASEIKAIKYRLQNVSSSQRRYRDMNATMYQGSSSLPKMESYNGRGDALFLYEDDVVGIEGPKEQLLDWVRSMNDGLEVISVVGMGGLGKTTLVKKVYDDSFVKKHFNVHVWIVASEYKDVRHLLLNLIRKLVGEIKEPPPQNLEGMSVDDMREFIYEFLKEKNYIIVLDDLWNLSMWHVIRVALPRRGIHGCIVIATRFYNIGNDACSETDHMYELRPLPPKESMELFQKKAFPRNPCPHYIREFAEKILKRCEGLPLAISVIGGLLATKGNSAEEWELFERSLGHELKGGGSLEELGKLLSLSYNDLPYYLKYSYLYLGIFPPDRFLEKETIIRLWITEGFVQPKQEKTMEEVAVDYLNDLVSRSLIQVAERDIDGRIRAFRVHDLLRDFINSKSREHNLVTVSNGGEMKWPSRIRRLVIQKSFIPSREINFDCLRSLILMCSENIELGIINQLVGRCRLLKVLDLRGAPLETIPSGVFKLYYLKYLCLRNTMVKLVPTSIKYLKNLETLDLKNCHVTELPVEILKLHKLRYVLVYNYTFGYLQSCKFPCDIGRNLPLLLKLRCVDATESDGMKIVIEVGKMTQLRRLGITKLRSEDGKDLCSSIAKLTNLRSLTICSCENVERLELDYSITLPFLRRLELSGFLEKVPQWIESLNGLTTLSLAWSGLREDPLNSFQDLPNLARLDIHGSDFEGLRFKAEGFKKLKELWLGELKCLKWVIVEKGSMPSLEEWGMKDCKLVTELPEGIEYLPDLQVVNFGNMGDEFVERVAEERGFGGVDSRLARVANVRFYSVGDDGIWIRGFTF